MRAGIPDYACKDFRDKQSTPARRGSGLHLEGSLPCDGARRNGKRGLPLTNLGSGSLKTRAPGLPNTTTRGSWLAQIQGQLSNAAAKSHYARLKIAITTHFPRG